MRDRRRARGALIPPTAWASQQLRDWISTPDSKVLQLQGSLLRAEQSRDVAIDLVQLLQATGLPVAWYLANNTGIDESAHPSITPIDILRSLIEQTIDQHWDATKTWGLNASHFAGCKTERDWLRLFVAVLAHVQRLVLVIDTQRAISGMVDMIAEFWRDVNERGGIQTTVKILILTYESPSSALSGFPVLPAATTSGRASPRSSPRQSRVLSRFGGRRCRAPWTTHPSEGPEDLKPFVLQLINSN